MKRYSWKAFSDEGSFEDKGSKWFNSHKEAYYDMRKNALEKMKWNTEWEDLDDNGDSIGYSVSFSKNQIVHASYSGIYTYEIVEQKEKVYLHEREWEVIDSFEPIFGKDWEVCLIYGIGALWMNNEEGYLVLIEESNRILKSDI